jgi:uncharacterized membrane protein
MLAVGISISLYLTAIMPIGITGMSDKETLDLILKQRENQDLNTLTGILIAVGFMLVLISFGARRKRKSGAKKVEKKPTTD